MYMNFLTGDTMIFYQRAHACCLYPFFLGCQILNHNFFYSTTSWPSYSGRQLNSCWLCNHLAPNLTVINFEYWW